MSIAVVYYVGMRKKYVLLSFGERCSVVPGLSSYTASEFITGKFSISIPVGLQPKFHNNISLIGLRSEGMLNAY